MDLRQEFQQILQDYGHPVLLIRQNKRSKCSCYDDITNTSSKQCPYCLGTGYLYQVEKHIARSMTASIPETLPRMSRAEEPGHVAIPSKMFYMKHDVRPAKNDLIAEVEWEGDKPIITEYSGLYEINYPEPYRGDNGRIEYFRAACRLDPIEATFRLNTIAGKQYIAIDRGD